MLVKAPRPHARRVSPLRMKTMNTVGLLTLLREYGPLSRSDLARISKLSKPTVSEQINDLMSRGLVVETGEKRPGSQRGKKPTLLQFNEDCGRVIAARVSATRVQVWEARLDGSLTHQTVLPIQLELGPGYVIQTLKDAIRPILNNGGGDPFRRRLISVATPGLVDVRNGIVLETDNIFGWRNVALGADLNWEFGVPVIVDNDVNLAVLAEARSGGGQDQQSFVLVQLDTGIGLGIFLNGAAYHGQHWAAGEIAHMVLDPALIGSPTGGRGHLESAVAMDRVTERVHKLAQSSPGPLASLLKRMPPVDALLEAEKQGHKEAGQLVRELAETLGVAVVNVSACYDPGKIILLGPLFSALFDRIRTVFESIIRWPVQLELSGLGEDVFLRGALVAGLARIFDRMDLELESPAVGGAANGAPSQRKEEPAHEPA
ncbi:MAG: ROK family transcriptional regulator [Bryobacterales bacterium]|nr:ROK family transcriptional regulator [Bryobacterales bacterium]